MDAQITLTVKEIIMIIGLIAIPLSAALVFIYKRKESQAKSSNSVLVELTRSFVEATKDQTKAVENNTRVIEKLPEQIMLHIKSNNS